VTFTGRLQYVGKHHLQFAGSKEYFLKAGPDAPETLLAYADFDNTLRDARRTCRSRPGSRTCRTGAGRSDVEGRQGQGTDRRAELPRRQRRQRFSFLPYNAGGDGDNVWPFVSRDDKLHYDCSKLDQWGIVFDHATALGSVSALQAAGNEIDDNRLGRQGEPGLVPESLDGGKLGPERKLYCRELIARFGHASR
jgi:hypothetical protein